VLADLLEQCWQLLIAPHWPRLRDLLQADVLYRTRRLGDYGLDRMLDDLDPRAHWTGHSILIDGPAAGRHRLGGAGLLLMPSVFVWPDLAAVIDPPARPALAYPARGIAELWQPAPTRHSPALARLLGRTRAALLESLAEPASTHTLARRHGLAPGTVSEHLTALHHARLITRRRHRHAVLYQQAPPRRGTGQRRAPTPANGNEQGAGQAAATAAVAHAYRAHPDVHPAPTYTSRCQRPSPQVGRQSRSSPPAKPAPTGPAKGLPANRSLHERTSRHRR
jgi:DNA-binding transcriptional ArsR family regulator